MTPAYHIQGHASHCCHCLEKGTGTRRLRSIMERLLMHAMYEVSVSYVLVLADNV